MIEIIAGGPLATVQDLGRTGHRALGVGLAGAMDRTALAAANLMLGNPAGAAGIEFTLGAFRLRFTDDVRFALTGADCGATLDGAVLPPWWCAVARAGQVLAAGPGRAGMRSYLAIAGGIDVPEVLGSRRTDLKGGFGGHQGRPLAGGDRIGCRGTPAASPAGRSGFGIVPPETAGDGATAVAVRVIPAPDYDNYGPEAHAAFWNAEWRIHPDSNRIGYRLAGPTLAALAPRELLSHGIVPGVVQVPPAGQPVIQMSDANTAGGYPTMGVVIGADLRLLAQARLGGTVRFVRAAQADAVAALRGDADWLARVARLSALAAAL